MRWWTLMSSSGRWAMEIKLWACSSPFWSKYNEDAKAVLLLEDQHEITPSAQKEAWTTTGKSSGPVFSLKQDVSISKITICQILPSVKKVPSIATRDSIQCQWFVTIYVHKPVFSKVVSVHQPSKSTDTAAQDWSKNKPSKQTIVWV